MSVAKHAYHVESVRGHQSVNGRQVETTIYVDERRCLVCDVGDPDLLAERAFDAGHLAAEIDWEDQIAEAVEFNGPHALVFVPEADETLPPDPF